MSEEIELGEFGFEENSEHVFESLGKSFFGFLLSRHLHKSHVRVVAFEHVNTVAVAH
jgi:hypothetical protein